MDGVGGRAEKDSASDAELVVRARRGDQEAKAMLFRRHVRLAENRAYRLLGRDSELEDVVQDAFATAFASLGKLQKPEAFAGWLSSIVTTTTIDAVRRRRLLSRLGLRSFAPVDLDDLVGTTAPPDVVAELRQVYGSFAVLEASERAVLVLRRIERLSLEEIAEQTRLSLATVKRRLAKAEERLTKMKILEPQRGQA